MPRACLTRTFNACKVCGTLIALWPCKAKLGYGKFCSRQCRGRFTKAPAQERFNRHVSGPTVGGCTEWTGALNPKGYGYFQIGRGIGTSLAHRFAYELANGAIPDGLCVLHRCDNPRCVNPEHLFLGTKQDNNADMVAKNRHHKGEQTGGVKLTTADVLAIRAEYAAGGTSWNKIARNYNVNGRQIGRIINRERWQHVV